MDEAYLNELATCDFIKKRKNIVMIGNPGTVKTHLSIAFGIKACNLGMKVKFYTAANYSGGTHSGAFTITPCITGDIKDFHTTKTESYIIRYRTQTVITLVGVFICIKHINYSIYVRSHKMFISRLTLLQIFLT